MPHLKRSEALQTLGAVTPTPRPTTMPTQKALHLRCPACGLMARLDLVEGGPYAPLYSRLQRYGGHAIIVWEPPFPATDEEYDLMVARLQTDLERFRPRPSYVPPTVFPPPPPSPVVAPPLAVPSFTLAERPGRRPAQALMRHLQLLEEIDVERSEVEVELDRLASDLQGWIDQVEEAISKEEDKEEPDQDKIDKFQEQRDAIEEAQTALGDRNIDSAINALEEAFLARPPRVPPLPIAERLEAQARSFRPRIMALRDSPDRAELERMEQDMRRLYDRVVDSAEVATGETKRRLQTLAQRLERSAEAFTLAFDALARSNIPAYLQTLDALIECCPK